MGHILTIDNQEAVDIATKLAGLHGQSLEAVVVQALRDSMQADQDREEWIAQVRRKTAEFRATLTEPLPFSDHGFLYDDEAVALARDMAEQSGETLDTIVVTALRSLADQRRTPRTRADRLHDVLAIATQMRALIHEGPDALNTDILYDTHTGLPV